MSIIPGCPAGIYVTMVVNILLEGLIEVVKILAKLKEF